MAKQIGLCKKNKYDHTLKIPCDQLVWVKKSSPPKTFCDIFTCGEPVQLKITVAIARTYIYV